MGARISYFAKVKEKEGEEQKDSVTIQILNREMKLVRTLKSVPENGLNRTVWRLDRKGVRLIFNEKVGSSGGSGRFGRFGRSGGGGEPGGGGYVLPGEYNLRIVYKGDTVMTTILVEPDPRVVYDMEGMKVRQDKVDQLLQKMEELNQGLSKIRRCKESYGLVKKLSGKELSDEMTEASGNMKKRLDVISKKLFRDESVQGFYYPSDALHVQMSGTYSILGSSKPITENQLHRYDHYMKVADEALALINEFLEGQWAAYRVAVEKEGISVFGE